MNNNDHYSAKLSIIQAIPDDKILIPGSIPVNVYLQEAENLYNWCQPDKDRLTANGLQWSIVEDLPARADALREAQARWETSDLRDTETEKQWNEKLPAAQNLRKDLVRSLKFVFRNNPAVTAKIIRFSEGYSNAAMIQVLRDISVFGNDHAGELKAAGFDTAKLDTAAVMSRELASLLGAVISRRAFSSGSLKIRNQAYTHLKEAVTEVKNHAQFVLWRDQARLRGYASEYNRRKNTKNRNKKDQESAEEVTE